MFHIVLRQTMHSDHRHSPWRVASIRGVRMVVVFLHSQYDIFPDMCRAIERDKTYRMVSQYRLRLIPNT